MDTNNDTPREALLYARISIADENMPKVERQLADLRKLADVRGHRIAGEYVDDGLSAANAENRPDFDRLLADLAQRPGAVLLATEESRFARNWSEKLAIVAACMKVGATWETCRDGAVDPATASGELMAGMRGLIDTFESRRKAERQRSANEARRQAGQTQPGQRPFGWRTVGAKPMRLEPIAQEQALIRWGIEMILTNKLKPWSVARAWNNTGIKTARGNDWKRTSVVSVLMRWRNAGFTEHNGEPVAKAEWEPICTKAELEELRAMLTKPVREPGWRRAVVLCSGIARCACGANMLATGNSQQRSYRCSEIMYPGAKTGAHVSIKVESLDKLVRDAVIAVYLHTPSKSQAEDQEAEALAVLHTRLDEKVAAKAEIRASMREGALTAAEANADLRILSGEVAVIEEKIAQAVRASAHAKMLTQSRRLLFSSRRIDLSAAVDVRRELAEVFDSLSLEDRRRLVAATVSVVVNPGRGDKRVSITGEGLPRDDS